MLKVSINGNKPQTIQSVVVFDDETPIAAVSTDGSNILFADAIRDATELMNMLSMLHVPFNKLPMLIEARK